MFDQVLAAMSNSTAQNGYDQTQRMMECTLRLTQAQMEVMKDLYDDLGREFAKTMGSTSDQSDMARHWPELMAAAARANAEAGALFMKNAKEYQVELLKMVQNTVPASAPKAKRVVR